MDPLDHFHPLVGRWFTESIGTPTAAQAAAWPRIAAGAHVLVTAPTGSGKTLTAFLWAIDRLVRGEWEGGKVRVLYVSPLRALNNDIHRNLTRPLQELEALFTGQGEAFPPIRAWTRSGDTPAAERRKAIRNPPEILITTPESLNILLTSRSGTDLLDGLTTVILDEVHAVAGSKRGTHLITAVERLTRLSGEFQRIALSATVRPLDTVARWVGGEARSVETIDAGGEKSYDVRVSYRAGEEEEPDAGEDSIWEAVSTEIAGRVSENRSTLVFANSRRSVEKVARLVNSHLDAPHVYSHHGSLSRELREVVEARLKAGDLDGIVATNSLELGIDVGAIDEVVLVQTPPSISSAVQRVGRAGHGVGETSRGRLYAIHAQDVVDASVVMRGLLAGDVEPVRPPTAPLDVLAQVILSMACTETWKADELFDFLRSCAPYAELTRRQYDLVVEMLAGRYAGVRVAGLRPRIALDRVDGTVRSRPGTARLIYAAGGTIPDRGYFALRHAETHAKIGELDEEFVWERSVGETFVLGVQAWKIRRITHNDVLVTPGRAASAMAPFWRAEQRQRSWWLAERVARFLESADGRLEDPAFRSELQEAHRLDEQAAEKVITFLASQRRATGASLPHRRHVVIERVTDPQARPDHALVLVHTMWGGRINRPYALALGEAISAQHGVSAQVMHDDRCVAAELPGDLDPRDIIDLVGPDDIDRLIRARLESTGFFGAAFREAAGRALLLPRKGFGRRTPLWLNRQRAKEMLDAVSRFEDFPILLETWRSCLQDEMDLPALRDRLAELEDGSTEVSSVTTSHPSPFASDVMWKRTNELMYEDDVPESGPSRLGADLIREVALSAHLRPRVEPDVVETLRRKLQRTFPGYAPRRTDDLVEWIKERVLVPSSEWTELIEACRRDHGIEHPEILDSLSSRVIAFGNAVCSVEAVARLRSCGLEGEILSAALDGSTATTEALRAVDALADDALDQDDPLASLLGEWLRFQGPLPPLRVAEMTGLDPAGVERAVGVLVDEGRAVVDELTLGAPGLEVCDLENLSRLLRMARASARSQLEALPVIALPLVLAAHQGLGGEGSDLKASLEKLFGFPARAEAWEAHILPARHQAYRAAWLDELMAGSDLIWVGCGERRLTFVLGTDRDLYPVPPGEDVEDPFPEVPGRFSVEDLAQHTGRGPAELGRALWELAWQGRVTNDGFTAVRRAAAADFKAAPLEPGRRRPRRASWKASTPLPGAWYRLLPIAEEGDALEREELVRDRARALVDRHGIVFRELLQRELPGLRWRDVFRALRIMELGGEVIGGSFIQGVQGLQFVSPSLLRRLRDGLDEERIWWLNATDPASPCGLGLEGLDLPRRVSSTHLVFHGTRLVVVSDASGKRLDIRVEPDHPRLPGYLTFLKAICGRDVQPRAVAIEEICGAPAASSPYRPVLADMFDLSADHRTLRLSRRY